MVPTRALGTRGGSGRKGLGAVVSVGTNTRVRAKSVRGAVAGKQVGPVSETRSSKIEVVVEVLGLLGSVGYAEATKKRRRPRRAKGRTRLRMMHKEGTCAR